MKNAASRYAIAIATFFMLPTGSAHAADQSSLTDLGYKVIGTLYDFTASRMNGSTVSGMNHRQRYTNSENRNTNGATSINAVWISGSVQNTTLIQNFDKSQVENRNGVVMANTFISSAGKESGGVHEQTISGSRIHNESGITIINSYKQ